MIESFTPMRKGRMCQRQIMMPINTSAAVESRVERLAVKVSLHLKICGDMLGWWGMCLLLVTPCNSRLYTLRGCLDTEKTLPIIP